MKKILLFTLCLVLVISLAACSYSSGSVALQNPVYPKSISFEDFNGQREVREKNPVDNSFINAMKGFSFSSASIILKGQSKNISYSPVSLYLPLALAATAANNATQDELFTALGVSGKGADFLSQQCGNLFRLLYSDNEIGKLKVANSVWLDKGAHFKAAFMTNAVENFYATLYNIDFSKESTAQQMSKWISDNTNGILSPKISLDKEQIMSIINTIYFKDEWVDRFNEKDTKPDSFYLEDGNKINCDFMDRTYIAHSYVRGDGFTSSYLALKNSGRMIFILPDKGASIDDLLSTPEKTALLFGTEGEKSGKVIFKIPKFSFGNELDLKDTLMALGVVSAFERNADFTNLTDDTAFISSIKQQVHFGIDEKGVEAAAFTQIDYCGAAPPKDEVAEIILNRPFLFAIASNNGTILFIGIVNNPLEK